MAAIEVTGLIPEDAFCVPAWARRALIGRLLSADDSSVENLRSRYPNLPKLPDTYEVVYAFVYQALVAAGEMNAAEEWDLIRPIIVRVPKSCAEIISA